jgi:hypothetical protein
VIMFVYMVQYSSGVLAVDAGAGPILVKKTAIKSVYSRETL